MPDWTKTMQQSFEYYIVDPGTWQDKKKLDFVKPGSTIDWDGESGTLCSATIDMDESIGEEYIRVYLITIQNGVRESTPLGTFLIQTPRVSGDGKVETTSVDSYSPLIELDENYPDFGYYLDKGMNIMEVAYRLVKENMRAPVVSTDCDETLFDNFIAEENDTWLTFIQDLIGNAKFTLTLDEMGRVLFKKKQETASLQPVVTFSDDNSSILYPEYDKDQDLYGIPNVVEVKCSNGSEVFYAKVVNDDPNSPTSTIRRGRQITHRETDPSILGDPTQQRVQEYAEQLLKELSSIERTITYKHAYYPVRVGDCVMLNYEKAGLVNVKAKVVSQSISCEPGCPVSETAVYTTKYWR